MSRGCTLPNRGFTLLEVMVAIAILAIALTTLLGSQSQSMLAAEQADFSARSALLARVKLAEIIAEDDLPAVSSGDFGEQFPGYSWDVEIDDLDVGDTELLADTTGQLRRIAVTVQRTDDNRIFTLQRVVVKGGRL
ncbi:type IV pilus modification PilV family protein [Desulfofustis glycolicus]|uniref:General secretion pathway protein I n=1 Tax=Desulfofustis glycolicus DSM 9705 TaxID=1121409 RepID=A0A1M5XEN2_9BACT|nr:type II secretion system protein [Desulfofustis glycolicus]MCB2218551.1 type II secretion system GspH family protein [Desulfobulbaceae bacterium]SHH98307.1 general secretion pathway protein I [Desulfofustis glycolicus DSM 9705]